MGWGLDRIGFNDACTMGIDAFLFNTLSVLRNRDIETFQFREVIIPIDDDSICLRIMVVKGKV